VAGAVADEPLILVVPVALATGVGIERIAALPAPDRLLLVLSLLAIGGLVAATLPVARRWLACLVVGAAGLHGLANGAALPPELSAAAFAGGVALAGFLLVVYAAELACRARVRWARTAVRVVGSWIAATGILVLGMPR
jgi:hydrogenase/urease accessory protein HupE